MEHRCSYRNRFQTLKLKNKLKKKNGILKLLLSELLRGYCLEGARERCTTGIAATEEWDPDSLASQVPTELLDYPKMNTNYADLLISLGVSDMSNDQITEELDPPLNRDFGRKRGILAVGACATRRWAEQGDALTIGVPETLQTVVDQSIATKLSMRVHEVSRTQNENRCRLKAIWRALADDARENRRKLRTHHLQTLESSLDERKGARITVSKLKIDLIKSYPELDGISDFCIKETH